MNLTPTNLRVSRDGDREELGRLLEAVCEERLTESEHARLEQILLADAGARAYYLHYMDLHGALYWDLAVAVEPEDNAVSALVDATILRLARPEPISASEVAASNATTVVRPALEQSNRLVSETWRRYGAIAVASCMILGLGFWIGNRTANSGQVALNPGTVGKQPIAGSNSRNVADAVGRVAPSGRHKFDSDEIKLSQSTAMPATDGTQETRSTKIGPTEVASTKIGSTGATEPPELNGVDQSPDSAPKNDQANNKTGSSAASSATVIAYIGEQLKANWSAVNVSPSPKADDAEWLRRLHLDLLGHIPSVGDFDKFLANRSPAKRAAEIDRLLDSPEFARNFATIWTNLLVGRAPREEVNRAALATFLRQKFGRNRPWQETVFDLVAAEGRTDQNGAANFLVAHLNGGAIPATGITSRLFLGTQLQCAQCHNHPFSNSKQVQFWEFNSFFQQAVVVRVPKYDPKTGRQVVAGIELATKDVNEPRYYETRNGVMQVAYPAFGKTKVDTKQVTDRRRELARLMTSSEDSSLAPAFVNRMWAHFHGRSFTPVVDDMGSHVSPSHPQLLDRLSQEFAQSGYDVKQLIRWICNSDAYQLTSRFAENNAKDNPETGDPPLFSHMYVKPMNPEQLYDSLVVATQGQVAGGPTLAQSDKTRDEWLRQFVVSFETEENDEISTLNGSITQSLLMMNGELVQGATAVQAGTWLHKLLVSKDNETERIQALFASALSRHPTTKELVVVKKLLKNGAGHGKKVSPEQAYQDIYWALLNSNEFILNH
jgi:hypothetical protein